MTETPVPGQVAQEDENGAFLVGDQPLYLKEPTKGQLMFVMFMAGITADEPIASAVEAMRSFVAVIKNLIIPPTEIADPELAKKARGWGYLREGVESGVLDLEDVAGLALAIVQRWGDEAEVEQNRATKRAAAKKAPSRAVANTGRRTR